MNKNKLQEIKASITNDYELFKKKSNVLSILRGISFLLIALSILLYFTIDLHFVFIILTIICFIVLLIIHNHIDLIKKYYESYLHVISNYERRIDGTYVGRKETTGLEFFENDKDFLKDLDIIGNNSLYQYLNICRTHMGRKKLYDSLCNNDLGENLYKRQEAIKELGENLEFCLNFEANNYRIEDNVYFSKLNKVTLKGLHIILSLGIFLFITFVILFILSGLDRVNPSFLIIPCIVQILNFFIFGNINKNALEEIKNINDVSSSIYDTLKLFKDIELKSEVLKTHLDNIIRGRKYVKKLTLISDFDSVRYNPLIGAIFNALVPFSVIISYLCMKTINNYSYDITKGIESFEEFEMLVSLCVIKHTKECASLPKRSEEVSIACTNVLHPLLGESKCVGNDFDTKNGINVITGSNMSGKTSFMRTIGINIVLMNAGTYVNATSFSASYLNLFTSMRISDDITKGISTFYAELLRIKKAIDCVKNNEKMLTLIDEVFSGTNSNDRIKGAISLMKMLDKPNSIVLITTHDFELCDIKDENIINYHFSEYYENDKIKFNYKLEKGKCTTTNAIYLMKLVGIEE